VQKLDSSLGASEEVESFKKGYTYTTSMSSQELLDKTWPEDAKLIADRVCYVMHISWISSRFNVHVWAKLDQDSDGKVTVGDLYVTLQKAREISPREAIKRLWAKFQSARESGPVVSSQELN
jgi:hypothetical protein